MGISYGRSIARGVLAYARIERRWQVFVEELNVLDLQRGNLPDGVIVHGSKTNAVELLAHYHIPAVNVSGMQPLSDVPSVLPYDEKIGRLGAEHFLERGFRHFGFWGIFGHGYSTRRQQGFTAAIEEAGYPCAVWQGSSTVIEADRQADRAARIDWIRNAPRPIGIMACNDGRARSVYTSAMEAGLRVPDEVAILGVDNDELHCETAGLSLSSIDICLETIGFVAAEMLEARMNGEPAATRPTLVAPKAVVVRQSTDVLAVPDTEVAAALRFIRESATRGIGVDDVANATALSRRMLERRFRQVVGRTLHDEIRRVQLDKVCMLLNSTDMDLRRIALACGLRSASYLSAVFHSGMRITPSAYRRQFRAS